MSRVTGDEVKSIINTTLTALEIAPFITAANLIVTDQLASTSLSDELLKEIERWLAAHLVAVRDPRVVREEIGDVQKYYYSTIAYQGVGSSPLISTPYGQQVLTLDTTGTLASLGKKKVIFTSIDLGLD